MSLARVEDPEVRLARLLDLQSLLASVSRRIGPAEDLHAVLQTVLDGMRSLVAFRGGTIQLLDRDGLMYVAASDPKISPEVAAARLPVGSGLSGQAIATRQPVYSPDLDHDVRVDPSLRRLGSNAGMASYLAVPLICVGRAIGLIQVDSTKLSAFDADDIRLLEGLATQVAGAIESARRYEAIIELERLKSDFIARVSHELRTPITIVSGFTETLFQVGGDVDDGQRQQILGRMRSAATRLSMLVDELLTVSGYEAGVIAPHPSPFMLRPVLEEVREASPAPAQVTIDCPPRLEIVSDKKLLRHALRLLVDNAVKYAGDARLTVAIDADTGRVAIDIADQGPGIEPALRGRVFERFTRGDDSLPGMGLGLPLARMLASALGATLEMLHPPEGGLVCRLHFTH